jgi:hypothetical protein
MGSLTKTAPKGEIAVMDAQEAAAVLEKELAGVSTGSQQGVQYANFSGKMGRYSVGKNKEDIDPERLFFMDFRFAIRGWNCWKGNKPVDKHRWRAVEAGKAVPESHLEDHGPYNDRLGEGWRPMIGFWTKAFDDPDITLEFTTDSVSGRNSVDDLMQETIQRVRDGEPFFPVFRFEREQFTAQDQTNWKPVFEVEGWLTEEQVGLVLADVGYSIDDALTDKKPTKAQLKKLGT